jgi:hypothetical protein
LAKKEIPGEAARDLVKAVYYSERATLATELESGKEERRRIKDYVATVTI